MTIGHDTVDLSHPALSPSPSSCASSVTYSLTA